MYHFPARFCEIQTKMKLFTALVVLAVAGSSAALSDFTTMISSGMYLDTSTLSYTFDSVFPNVIMSTTTFDYLTQGGMAPQDVADYITNTRQNYKPWYTAIQSNIDTNKADVLAHVTKQIEGLKVIPDKIEAGYLQMVKTFTDRGCIDYSTYQSTVQSNLMTSVYSISSSSSSFSMNVYGAIPTDLISPFASALQTSLYTPNSYTSVSTLDAIKQTEGIYMDRITKTYGNAVAYTSAYIKDFYTALVTSNLAKIDATIASMVEGAKTATC